MHEIMYLSINKIYLQPKQSATYAAGMKWQSSRLLIYINASLKVNERREIKVTNTRRTCAIEQCKRQCADMAFSNTSCTPIIVTEESSQVELTASYSKASIDAIGHVEKWKSYHYFIWRIGKRYSLKPVYHFDDNYKIFKYWYIALFFVA